ncbi:MAG: mandelate racemase/muconate lactonizing enzyme family protein [Anaerolineae bacterium]|nr:mandelate racemase/muconate lactonizing enzyme family protein [Anaerolineae bacterium]
MKGPIIERVERTWVSVPLKPRHNRHLTRENWDWTVFEIIRLYTDTDLVGVGETMIYYTWGKVPKEQEERVIGHTPFEFLWDDSLGAGLQMAIWDLAGKALEVPCYKLMGTKVRDWCPVSWWTNDMSTEDWVEEIKEALSLGYMSAKLKARPWRDFYAQMEALNSIVPQGFQFDADFNAFLLDVGTAVPYLLELEKIPTMAIFESPIPQGDVEGNRLIRQRITKPIAMHYGSPPIQTTIREEVCDGFVIGGGASRVREQGTLAAQMNKPFWLQMVGTGLTTAFMLHFAATLSHARWPAITCHEIYVDDLLQERIEVRQGYAHVPEEPGLGVALDEEAVERYKVEEGFAPPPPRNLYRVVWPSGASVIYPVGKRGTPTPYKLGNRGVWDDFAMGNQPLFARGVRLEIIPDDGSPEWEELNRRAQEAPIRE